MYRLFVLVIFMLSSSCSILMPYEEKFACNRGLDTGLCGSVTDVYEYYDRGYSIKEVDKVIKRKEGSDKGCYSSYYGGGGVCK